MAFSPVDASKTIFTKYLRYLQTIFALDDDDYNRQFVLQLKNQQTFASGPYLNITDAFEKTRTIADLIAAGVLEQELKKIQLPTFRPLYLHQEQAILNILSGRNTIVSTGTGSGKTESFLIPILNELLKQKRLNRLGPGVRALLIYPMNALANDQMERLRNILSDLPEITYGSYTGQTKESYEDALSEYRKLNEDQIPKPNELISREQMKKTPPQVLITNYAMLEYLMLRPGDSTFFGNEFLEKWKFVVLDEAHVYSGSSGIEVAMLLRRLKARLNNWKLQYILTSATLGDEDGNQEVAEFGKLLCNAEFGVNDIIRASRIKLERTYKTKNVSLKFYVKLAELLENEASKEELVAFCQSYFNVRKGTDINTQLFDFVLHDENYSLFREALVNPKTIAVLASELNWSTKELESFVKVASKAEKNDIRLIDARYHMFLRATESVFITLPPNKKLFLNRKETHYDDKGIDFHVFEVATCNVCHAIYLIGTVKNDILVQSSFQSEDDLKSVFLLQGEINDTDDDHLLEEENIDAQQYEICARCGFVRKAGLLNQVSCEHGNKSMVKVVKVTLKDPSATLKKCLACENVNNFGILRMFFTGQEAVTSVIGTALFQELPSYKMIRKSIHVDTDSGFETEDSFVEEQKISEAKQFIAFSDNRQAAAFYASYLDQTYRNILYKRIIIETIRNHAVDEYGLNFDAFAGLVSGEMLKYKILSADNTTFTKEAYKAVLHEFIDYASSTSLFSKGMLGFSIDTVFQANTKINLTQDEVLTLCNVLLLGLLADGALKYGVTMNKEDKTYFANNGVEFSYTLSAPDRENYIRSFIPRFVDKTNKRTDYFYRVLQSKGNTLPQKEVNKLLEAIWSNLLISKKILAPENGSYKVNTSSYKIMKPVKWYECSKCSKITQFNLNGVCPSYRCMGRLHEFDIEKELKENHYYNMYQELDIRPLRVVEHTAQLSRDMAYEYQKRFKLKDIDILSCSTTFEMGVDVGNLETVFMRNMPPSPANYAQRAGRAGRNKDSAAYALTFCNKSNHDFTFFNEPLKMIKGKITPPKFNVENKKIAIRHIFATALSAFWRKNPVYFGNAMTMLDEETQNNSGVVAFYNYLLGKPMALRSDIKNFLPESLYAVFDVGSFGWIDELFRDDADQPGAMTKALSEYKYEIEVLQHAKDEAYRTDGRTDGLTERINSYKREDILSFLSRKNILPKYGFPVDTVELTIMGGRNQRISGLQLQRDLSMAISEYAPGSQIIANGDLITSRYIRKIPRMGWRMYDYIYCNCGTLNIEVHTEDVSAEVIKVCQQCGEALENTRRKIFIIPLYGFETDVNSIKKPGLKKPEKTYKGDIYYVGYKSKIDLERVRLALAEMELSYSIGDEMAVLNESNFYVCADCGYTELDEKKHTATILSTHKKSSGYKCGNRLLKRYSLGYRFETDVFQVKFLFPEIRDYDEGLSILNAILRGISSSLNIEQDDIAGCLQFFRNPTTGVGNYAIIFYDRTPGGAGHVRRLNDPIVLEEALKQALELVNNCICGGEDHNSSCYSCLRSYYNQKFHDRLKRKYAIDFLKQVLG